MSRKVGDALRAPLEPFVVTLGDDDTALPSLDAAPHAPTLLQVLRPRVDRVQSWGLGLAPVGDEAPFH